MTFADLQAMKRVSDPQISPSGKWVLFSVTDVSLEKNSKTSHLWIVPLDGSAKERQLTTVPEGANGRFSPDGKWVMFSSTGQLWVAPFNDAAGTLGGYNAVPSLKAEADGGVWAPDSRHILFAAPVYPECESKAPTGRQHDLEEVDCNARKYEAETKNPVKAQIFTELLYRHWNSYVGSMHSHIFYGTIDGKDGPPTDLTPSSVIGDHEAPTFSLGGPLGYAISPDGKEIAYVTNLDKVPAESTNNDIFVLQVGAAPQTAKRVSTSLGSDDGPQYSPDGKWLAWRSQKRAGFESDKFRLFVMDRATGKTTDVMPKFDNWVDEFLWSPDSTTILFTSGYMGEENVYGCNISKQGANTIPEPWLYLLQVEGDLSQLAWNGDKLVGAQMKVDSPTELFVYDFTKPGSSKSEWAGEVPLTHLNRELVDMLALAPMESFTYPGANGTKVQGFLIKPPNFDPAKKYPLKFLIHGGPQGAWGDAWSYRWNPELFAANGYVVVMINPRGSTGYGQQFVDEVSGDWGGRPYVDLMKGLDYAEKTYPFIDKTRECALGASYGGFMADWILTHTNRFACIVTHDGAYNLQSMFGTTEELWFPEWEFRPLEGNGPDAVVEQTKPAHPWDFAELPADKDPFRKWSPRMYIDHARTPTLVIHGQKDYRLDVSEGLQLFTALQLRGVPSKMLYFPDEGHWVLKPQNSQLWYDTVNDWCDQWTHTNKYAK